MREKRYMSIERLGLLHVAAMAPEGVEPGIIDFARSAVTMEDMEGLTFGPTFAETLALNTSTLDVFIP